MLLGVGIKVNVGKVFGGRCVLNGCPFANQLLVWEWLENEGSNGWNYTKLLHGLHWSTNYKSISMNRPGWAFPQQSNLDDHVTSKTRGICNKCEGVRITLQCPFPTSKSDQENNWMFFSLFLTFKGSVIVQCAIVVAYYRKGYSDKSLANSGCTSLKHRISKGQGNSLVDQFPCPGHAAMPQMCSNKGTG